MIAVFHFIQKDNYKDSLVLNIIATIFGGIFLGAYSHALIFEIGDKTDKWLKATNLITFGISYISMHIFSILKSEKFKDVLLLFIDFIKGKIKKYLNIK